jgi:membrane associated rhomboid family serine protease
MNQLRFQWTVSDAVTRLIIINVFIFLAIQIPLSLLHLFGGSVIEATINQYLLLPGAPMEFITKPWTLLTHMFMHAGLLHLLFNMLTLYFTGQLFARYFNDKRLLSLYFAGGLAGAIVFLVAVNVFPLFTRAGVAYTAAGASAAILSVLIGIAAFRPDDDVFLFGVIRIKLRWLALIIMVLDVIQIRSGNAAGHLAHLGGAVWGIVWGIRLRSGSDSAAFLNPLWEIGKPKSKLKVTHRAAAPRKPSELNMREKQTEIDKLLDKISRSGYDSLSKDEKQRLFELTKEQ